MAQHIPIEYFENDGIENLTLEETREVIAEIRAVFSKMAKYLWYMKPFEVKKRNGKEHIGRLMKLTDDYAKFTNEEYGITEKLSAYSYEPKIHNKKHWGIFEIHHTIERGEERIVKIYYVI